MGGSWMGWKWELKLECESMGMFSSALCVH